MKGLAEWRLFTALVHESHERWILRLIQSNFELAERRTISGSRLSWTEAVVCRKCVVKTIKYDARGALLGPKSQTTSKYLYWKIRKLMPAYNIIMKV